MRSVLSCACQREGKPQVQATWWTVDSCGLNEVTLPLTAALPDVLELQHELESKATNRDSVTPIHELIHRLESQAVISRTCSSFNSPIWPVPKSNGEWMLTEVYRGLNEVMLPLSAAITDMLELQCEVDSKAAKWCHN